MPVANSVKSIERAPILAPAAILLASLLAFVQRSEYEFYFDFRTNFSEKLQEPNHWSLTNEQVLEAYTDGTSESEIARRHKLLRTQHSDLEADFYSRYYLDSNVNFNHGPNGEAGGTFENITSSIAREQKHRRQL